MVRQGDIEISLVHADTKEPFKEHTKEGKVYVEVEPNAEYFICIHRVGSAIPETLLTGASVDGKSLGYQVPFAPRVCEPYHAGLWTRKDSTSTQTALMFTKPRSVQAAAGGDQKPQLLMGKVEVEIYTGIFCGYAGGSNYSTSWEESTIDHNLAGSLAEKKSLRSGKGEVSFSKQDSGHFAHYTKGPRVDVFTLHYCAAMGLIQVGVLPKPPLWVYARMLHPANPAKKRAATTTSSSTTTTSDARPTKIIRSTTNSNQENELFDLSNVKNEHDSDEE
jgi:hypothetical protein